MDFDLAFDKTMSWEGGGEVHRVSGDTGGTTKWGFSQRSYPCIDIASLSERQARRLAGKNYWHRLRVGELPQLLQWHVFDTAFNMGAARAAKLLQKAVNMYARSRWSEPGSILVEDGQVGPLTVRATWEVGAPEKLLALFVAYRIRTYIALAEQPQQAQFVHGWLRRAKGGRND